MEKRRKLFHFMLASVLVAMLVFGGTNAALGQDSKDGEGLSSLKTETPEEGFALAVKLSQKAVGMTQADADVRKQLRPAYAHDPDSLIAVSHVVATHFQTVAAANDYWRE